MEMNGLKMEYFTSQEEALSYADELIRQSALEFGFDRAVVETKGFSLLTKFRYVKSEGKERTWTAEQKNRREAGHA